MSCSCNIQTSKKEAQKYLFLFFSAFHSSVWYKKSQGGGGKPPLDTPLMYTRFQTKTAQKPYPLGRHIPI